MKIAISGKMRSGKDFIAQKIIDEFPEYRRVAFADKLKEMVKDNFDVDKSHENGREILQLYGKIGRLADPLFWVKEAIDIYPFNYNIIITDLRFKNEAEFLKKQGYFLVRVEACRETRILRGELSNEEDISETDLDDYNGFDYILENNKDDIYYMQLLNLISKR